MRRTLVMTLALLALAACTKSNDAGSGPIKIGAVYPLTGTQAMGGETEYRGVQIAAQLVNRDGGIGGRQVQLVPVDAPTADAGPVAIQQLSAQGIDVVFGSYGSTISATASQETAARGMLFWETGAVGSLTAASDAGQLTFRVPPTGGTLGRSAISFIAERFAKELGRDPSSLRFAIAYVNDVYGRSVADGAQTEIENLGLKSVGSFGYDLATVDMDALARRIGRAHPNVLFASAYLPDGVALRRALVHEHVPLLTGIGTSSSYCMPEFGARLGRDAVGLFASDKPDAEWLNPSGLSPDAAALLTRANDAYEARWGGYMDAPALAGFSGAWALLHDVLPAASDDSAAAIAAAARAIDLPEGSLPNGSGLRFGAPGSPGAGDNLAAASVIWEWIKPGVRVIVWPPRFATKPVEVLRPVA